MYSVTTRQGHLASRNQLSRPLLYVGGALVLIVVLLWILHLVRQAQATAQRGGAGGATTVAVAAPRPATSRASFPPRAR